MIDTATQAAIARLAHALWIADGGPHGRDLDYWLDAEQRVLAELAEAARFERAVEAMERGAAADRRPMLDARQLRKRRVKHAGRFVR